jgi:hypothetical protein
VAGAGPKTGANPARRIGGNHRLERKSADFSEPYNFVMKPDWA